MDDAHFDPTTPAAPDPSGMTVRSAAGVLLLMLGGVVCIGVLLQLGFILNAEAPPAVVRIVTPDSDRQISLGSPPQSFILAPQVFSIVGYAVVVLVLAMMTAIAKVLIQSGTALLEPSPRKLLNELITRIRDSSPYGPE